MNYFVLVEQLLCEIISDGNFSGIRVDPEILDRLFRTSGLDQLVLDDVERGSAVRVPSLNGSDLFADFRVISDLESLQCVNL